MKLAPLLSSLVLSSLPLAVQEQPRRSDAELQPLVRSLAAYFEARFAGQGVDDSRASIGTELDLLQVGPDGVHPLRRSRDVGRAYWLAQGYRAKGLRAGKVSEDTFEHKSSAGEDIAYAYRVPKEYDPEHASYPLILALPDADEKPADHLRAHWTARALLDGAILVSPAMPAERAEWDQVQVNGRPGGLTHVLGALRIAVARFAVDADRIYVAGRGKGVPAAIAAGNYAPQSFAGILGRAGDAGELGPDNFGNLPTLFQGGGPNARAFQEANRERGFDNCLLQAGGSEEELWEWIEAHPRDAFPEQVRLVVGQPFPTRVNWLRVAPIAPDAGAEGRIERESNTITIASHGVSHVTLTLNDELVDLNRPVRVLCNERDERITLKPSLPFTLDALFDGTSDAGCVYVGEIFLAVESADGTTSAPSAAADPELERRLAAAEGDVEKLWELVLWCAANARIPQSERVLRRIVRLDPDHVAAREALGQAGVPGLWFPWPAAYERYVASQVETNAAAKGHVLYKGSWIHPEERSFANKGWTKDWPTGQWLSPSDRRRLDEGWVRQDLAWIPPDEAGNVEDGRWRVNGEWVDLATAERRHARLDAMWIIPSREILLHSTVDRATSLRALDEMAKALADLRRVFGTEPPLPLSVAVVRDEEQYDRLAFGAPDGRRAATDSSRMHRVHSAYFADRWYERVGGEIAFRGMGVCLWDPLVPYGDRYGMHAARLAAGLSFVEALDPSPKTVRKARSKGIGADYAAAYQAEKKLPAWLRHGGAVYAERFFFDPYAAALADAEPEGEADPWWARRWSLDNLKSRGGMRPLQEVLAFALDPSAREDAQKLLLEAGLVVAFAVDGGCEAVDEAHAALKRALVAGSSVANEVEDLTEALLANEDVLRAFAQG